MFEFPEVKMIMDSVHGYINIPKCFVDYIIDTEEFQRLRNIDQTGMRILYPNAKHDRFSHSLGVYHLGCKAVDTLLNNFYYEDYWKISSDSKSILFWAKNKVLFLIACLLHDIGHTPFSHALEKIVLDNSITVDESGGSPKKRSLTDTLSYEICKLENFSETVKNIVAAPHEIIGSVFIITHLYKNIEKIFDSLIENNYPFISSTDILYAEHYNYNPIIDKTDLNFDIAFIVRMILGLKYSNFKPENQIKNCFIELLNGGNFDVDKLDYVIRDTKMSGISNINIDIERLLNSLCIVTKTKYINNSFSNKSIRNRVIPKMLGTNNNHWFHLKGTFRGTILIGKDSEVTIYKNSTFLSLIPINQGNIKYAKPYENAKFSPDTYLEQDGKIINNLSGKDVNNQFKVLDLKDYNCFSFQIRNARITSDDFHFIACASESWNDNVAEIQINGYCDINIKGAFSLKSSATLFDTSLDGNFDILVVLGNEIKDTIPNENIFNEFSVGYKKQAINIIANVLEARDYLFLWIYAHHKVMYYANFLIPLISRTILKITSNESFPIWGLDYDNIMYLDDAYVWTAIKHYHITNKNEDPEWNNLCEQLLSRKYLKSLYKSLAEFDLLFEKIPLEKRSNIKTYIINHLNNGRPRLDDSGAQAGYLDNFIMDQLKEFSEGRLNNILDIVYVDANYKTKRLNVNDTFILSNNGMISSVDEIPLLAGRIASSTDTSYYFYLYYNTNTQGDTNCKNEIEILKKTIRDFFSSIIKRT